jgi:hypothetical protein
VRASLGELYFITLVLVFCLSENAMASGFVDGGRLQKPSLEVPLPVLASSRERYNFVIFEPLDHKEKSDQGLAEEMLSWLAGSAVTHMYLSIEVFGFYSTRAVG